MESAMNSKSPMVVSGGGLSPVNGVYARSGVIDGVPLYTKRGKWGGKDQTFSLYRCIYGSGKRWYISIAPPDKGPGTDKDTDFYYAESGDFDVLPPKSKWMVDSEGLKPAPKVKPLQVHATSSNSSASSSPTLVTPQASPRQASFTTSSPPCKPIQAGPAQVPVVTLQASSQQATLTTSSAPRKPIQAGPAQVPVVTPQASPRQASLTASSAPCKPIQAGPAQVPPVTPTARASLAHPAQTVASSQSSSSPSQVQAIQGDADADDEEEKSAGGNGDEANDEESDGDVLEEGGASEDGDADREFGFSTYGDDEHSADESGEDEGGSSSNSEGEDEKEEWKFRFERPLLQKSTTLFLKGYDQWREFMDKLIEGGVDKYVDLPMIAVMGDTSSGKSSLLSNISFVELPSSDTLTTRCPIRLQMRYAERKWACVKVVWKDLPAVGNESIHFGAKTVQEENWSDITNVIAEAQAHIIEKSGKEVARDMVCVDMKGPHCENLTLIDLPGIVRSAGKGESATLTEDIHALMKDYLSNERCVILAVHPCNVDFHNSGILAEARNVDPDTKRTIPVLTKPDLIDLGAETSVDQLLHGKKTDNFTMGFHMVKGRGQRDLNEEMSIEDGLIKEEAFFRNNEPWRKAKDKSKFGTKNLRIKLAGLQMKLIQSSFKSILSEMKENRDTAALELKSLGEVPSNLVEKRALFRRVREQIWNGLGAATLDGKISSFRRSTNCMRPSAEFHLASKKFKDELNSSKLANVSSVEVGTEIIAIVDGKEVRDEVCYIDEQNGGIYIKKKRIMEKDCVAHATWEKVRPGHIICTRSGRVVIERKNGTYDELRPIEPKLVHSSPRWISELIKKNRPYSLPIFLNQEVFNAIVADQIGREWSRPSMDLLDFTAKLMAKAAVEFIEEMDSIRSLPSLANFLVEKSFDVVESIKEDTKGEIDKLVHREQTPYTQNHYLFENISKVRTERLMDEVLSTLGAHCGTEKAMREASPESLNLAVRSVFERNQRKSVDEHMAEEMQNALDGYGKVAVKRFVDNVPMICIGIMQKFPEKMNEILFEVTDDEVEQLVSAPSGVIARMTELKDEVTTLEKGMSTIKALSRDTY